MGKIMIVDDDESIRVSLRRLLSSAGYDTSEFPDAYSALDAYKSLGTSDRPKVIITDYRMEGIDGLTLAKMIKEYDKDAHVCMITGTPPDDEGQARQVIDAILEKPFDKKDLFRIIEGYGVKPREGNEVLAGQDI